MEIIILNLLRQNSDRAYKPTEISLLIGHPKGKNTARTVNSTLYKLQKAGQIVKMSDTSGGNPHWRAVQEY